MVRLFIILISIALISCKDSKLQQYERIVKEADRFEIYYKATGKTVSIPKEQIDNFKDILTRNVKPELQRKFINDVQVNISKNNKRTAFLRIANGGTNPFANFSSDGLNFGFRLTYGIGMTIDNISSENGP